MITFVGKHSLISPYTAFFCFSLLVDGGVAFLADRGTIYDPQETPETTDRAESQVHGISHYVPT